MNILLINNFSSLQERLHQALHQHQVQEIAFQTVKQMDINHFDCIILSGGSMFTTEQTAQVYADEIELIRTAKIPILGICLGFELIALSFDEELRKPVQAQEGVKTVTRVQEDDIFQGIPQTFQAYEHHQWILPRTRQLVTLATSDSGVEVLKHPDRSIYATQFHPEKFIYTTQGHVILENFLHLVKKQD